MNDAKLEKLQILSFVLDDEFFGTEIGIIQEVIEYREVTKVPRTPEFMLGVTNLRGQVIPVIDLRRYFNIGCQALSVDTCIIIIELMLDNERTSIGVLADRVCEVLELDVGAIKPPPNIGTSIDNRFIYGIADHDEQLIVLLTMSKIFSHEELQQAFESGSVASQQHEVASESQ